MQRVLFYLMVKRLPTLKIHLNTHSIWNYYNYHILHMFHEKIIWFSNESSWAFLQTSAVSKTQLQPHKLSILVLSVKLALKLRRLTSSDEWFWLLTDSGAQMAQLENPRNSALIRGGIKKARNRSEGGSEVTCGLSAAHPKFTHSLVKEQSVWHNCTSLAIKPKKRQLSVTVLGENWSGLSKVNKK